MKAMIGLMLLTLSATANAGDVPCEFLDSKGKVIGQVLAKADTEAAAQIYAAQSSLVVLDGKLFVHEGFELGRALKGELEPVSKIKCEITN